VGNIDPSKISVIWETPAYPDYNWSIRGDADKKFGAGFTGKVTKALLDLTDKDLLASFPRAKFVPASNDDYTPIEQVGAQIGLLE
jgi:phosphonate transport system substrate-binding protein